MSKLFLSAFLSLLVSLTACVERPDVADDPADTIAEISSDVVVAGRCTEQLTNDNDACTRAYNTCMAAAQTRRDKIACGVARAACMTEAFARYVRCLRGQTTTSGTADSAGLETVTDTQGTTEAAVVVVDPCAAQLNRDLRACDVNYHRCMEAAHTALDQLACVDANTQCMLNAIDRYFDCISRTPVPATPAPAPEPAPVPGSSTSRLERAFDLGGLVGGMTGDAGPIACGSHV
jgi:hypothetical protein